MEDIPSSEESGKGEDGMIKMFGKHRYHLNGAYKERRKAVEMVKALRASTLYYARLEKVPDYSVGHVSHFYRVWVRNKPIGKK